MDGLDLKKLAAEVSAEHGIRIDADDPVMAVITLNRLVFEQVVERAMARLQASADEIDRAAARVQIRTGSLMAQELKECAANFERQTRSAIDDLVGASKQGRSSRVTEKARRIALGLVLAASLLFLLGVYVGMHVAAQVRIGG
jgi:hypothetical protein